MLFDRGVKHWTIEYDGGVLTERDLFSAQMEIRQSIMSNDTLRFGGCEASSVTFSVFNDGRSYLGQTLTISAECDGEVARFGSFKVETEELTSNRESRKITAYDALYEILNRDFAEWYDDFMPSGTTRTIKQFRDSFCAYCGLFQKPAVLQFDDLQIVRTIDPDSITGNAILSALCELNGVFGRINEDDLFEYVSLEPATYGLTPSDDLVPSDDLAPDNGSGYTEITKNEFITAEYEDYEVERITKVQIRQEAGDIGAIAGDGTNAYVMQGNFLLYGMGAETLANVARGLLDKIGSVWYIPAKVTAFYDNALHLGDAVFVQTKHGGVITYIMQRVVSGVQSMRAVYTADGKQYQSEKVNSVNTAITQLRGKTNKLVRTVEELSSTITDDEHGLISQIKQNADAIALRVQKGSVISEINQTAETIKIQAGKIDLVGLVNADEFEAKFATVGDLAATDAHIDRVEANAITASELNATNARVSSLEADHVSVGSFNALSGTVNGKLSADELSSAITNIDMVTIGGSLRVGAYNVSWQQATFQGKTIYYLGRS